MEPQEQQYDVESPLRDNAPQSGAENRENDNSEVVVSENPPEDDEYVFSPQGVVSYAHNRYQLAVKIRTVYENVQFGITRKTLKGWKHPKGKIKIGRASVDQWLSVLKEEQLEAEAERVTEQEHSDIPSESSPETEGDRGTQEELSRKFEEALTQKNEQIESLKRQMYKTDVDRAATEKLLERQDKISKELLNDNRRLTRYVGGLENKLLELGRDPKELRLLESNVMRKDDEPGGGNESQQEIKTEAKVIDLTKDAQS